MNYRRRFYNWDTSKEIKDMMEDAEERQDLSEPKLQAVQNQQDEETTDEGRSVRQRTSEDVTRERSTPEQRMPANTEQQRSSRIAADEPIAPLPNPGEGGPVAGGNTIGGGTIPGIGTIIGGQIPGVGTIIGGGQLPSDGTVIGGGMNQNSNWSFPGTIITIPFRPQIPCFFCNGNDTGSVRFLNAAAGYQPFVIVITGRTVINNLEYAEISEYGRVSTGYQTISVQGLNGYVYVSKQIQITAGEKITIAIINVAGGLDFTVIDDEVCNSSLPTSCIRACNLSYNSGPISVYLGNNLQIFGNVVFTEVTDYRRILPGNYMFRIMSDGEFLTMAEINARIGSQYTMYCFNWDASARALRTLIVEDRI